MVKSIIFHTFPETFNAEFLNKNSDFPGKIVFLVPIVQGAPPLPSLVASHGAGPPPPRSASCGPRCHSRPKVARQNWRLLKPRTVPMAAASAHVSHVMVDRPPTGEAGCIVVHAHGQGVLYLHSSAAARRILSSPGQGHLRFSGRRQASNFEV